MSTIPPTQKAWLVTRQGIPSHALSLQSDLPVPTSLAAGDVLVKVQAAALNPIGYKTMKVFPNWMESRPRPAEYDLAGQIYNSNGSNFKNGDQVFGFVSSTLSRKIRQGALAEYTRMPADHLVIRPPNVTAVEAAGLTLSGQTAYRMLFTLAHLEAGQSVFVNGGTTSVGIFAIQMAKANGIHVLASASSGSEEFVKELGAEFIDYKKAPLHTQLTQNAPNPKFDAILDTVGLQDLSLYTHSPAYLAPSGIFVAVLNVFNPITFFGQLFTTVLRPTWLGGTPRKFGRTGIVANDPIVLQAIQTIVADGKLKPIVDSVFSFDDALKAYDRIMTGRTRGKVIVKVVEDAT